MEKYRYDEKTGWYVCIVCGFRCVAESLMKAHQDAWQKAEEAVSKHKK